MIDQKILRTDINEVTKLLLRKGYTLNIENWNKLEKKRAKIQVKNHQFFLLSLQKNTFFCFEDYIQCRTDIKRSRYEYFF